MKSRKFLVSLIVDDKTKAELLREHIDIFRCRHGIGRAVYITNADEPIKPEPQFNRHLGDDRPWERPD